MFRHFNGGKLEMHNWQKSMKKKLQKRDMFNTRILCQNLCKLVEPQIRKANIYNIIGFWSFLKEDGNWKTWKKIEK